MPSAAGSPLSTPSSTTTRSAPAAAPAAAPDDAAPAAAPAAADAADADVAMPSAAADAPVVDEEEEEEQQQEEEEEEEEEEEDLTQEELVERFLEITEDLDAPGAAVGGDASLPQPLLRVQGVDDALAWPLPTVQAQQLMKVAERAAHGRDEAKVVDTDAWRIKADQLSFENPRWQPALDALVRTATEKMGVVARPGARLARQSAALRRGRQVQEAPRLGQRAGMFGTLVIALPSAHEVASSRCTTVEKSSVLRARASASARRRVDVVHLVLCRLRA